MDKYDTSQLTEFPRYEEEPTQSGVTTFFNKLWKLPLFSPSETTENLQSKAITDGKQDGNQAGDKSGQDSVENRSEAASYGVELEGRSLPNVLKRISSLVAMGSVSSVKYSDTELARYWMPDDIARECYECACRFSTLRRRHHCRVCGQIFCSRCCSLRVPGHIFGCAGGLRVCNYCCNVVLSYLKENENGETSTDLRTLQENLQVKFPSNQTQQSKARDNFMFSRDQDDRYEIRSSTKETLQDVFKHLSFTLPVQQHRYRLVRYNGVWRGCDILQWVMDNTEHKTRAQATIICQNLLNAGYMECMSEITQFADYALYKPIALPPRPADLDGSPEEQPRILSSVSSYCLDLNLGANSARLIKTPKTEAKPSPTNEDEPLFEQSENGGQNTKICRAISQLGEDHIQLLLRQCLSLSGLAQHWANTLYPLLCQAASIINIDINSNDIDPRNYVQIKKVEGGKPTDCCLIHGVVLTKNVAHRSMPQVITDPSILILDCSIAYQRGEDKFTSLEPVLMQEEEYLGRMVARVCDMGGSVVLTSGAISGTARGALGRAGRAAAGGLKRGALARAARGTGARPAHSVAARVNAPCLGRAKLFRVANYPTKTLMIFEGCAYPNLACCILLRGASRQELIKVKKVATFILLACYNWKLEKAFLADIDAVLPESGVNFDEDDVFDQKVSENAKKVETSDEKRLDDVNVNLDDFTTLNENKELSDKPLDESFDLETVNENLHDLTLTENKEICDIKDTDDLKTEDTESKQIDNITNQNEPNESTQKTNESVNVEKREFDDPLLKAKSFRKIDSDKTLSTGVPIKDFSDPLRSTDDEVFISKEDTEFKADDDHSDRWSTDDTVLSMSPLTLIPPPPRTVNLPKRAPPTRQQVNDVDVKVDECVTYKEMHPFISQPITTTADDPVLKASLAHYRATGCRLLNNNHSPGCPFYKPSVLKPQTSQPEPQDKDPDPLDPEHHQKISVLLYSYSAKSGNRPDFCVNPWVMTMEMYNKNDTTLGAFLDKYCFSSEFKCNSNNCQVPMNQHVRKFVHGDMCVTITCNTVGHSGNADKLTNAQSKQVVYWSRCNICNSCSVARRLSQPTNPSSGVTPLAGSLAGWLSASLRPRGLLRPHRHYCKCTHKHNQYTHAFTRGETTAHCRVSKISTYDIVFPPEVIATRYDTKQMRHTLLNQLNELMLKGHETFTNVSDSEAEKDYGNFKQHTEQIHLALTSSQLQENTSVAAVVKSLWSVSDKIITCEKMLRDAQEKWSSPVKPVRNQVENNPEEKSDLEDSSTDAGNKMEDSSDVTDAEEDEEKGDKKTVRQILSQLLSNNQPSNQPGIIISSGIIPVVVLPGEIGSVIAATLASVTYQRTLRQLQSVPSEQEETESTKEKADGDKSKTVKSSDHIEVLLKDGLSCRVYFPRQFVRLRRSLLASLQHQHIHDQYSNSTSTSQTKPKDKPTTQREDNKSICDIEEGFIRSLAYCVPWAAKGGKSGSTFCKTKDDRYVLKEMTKPEWQQFLEFAPHYFNYVMTCHQNKQHSLLARIVGVYSVGGAGNGVLVMENIWYCCSATAARFDLKGSSRHRLSQDTQPASVQMDENLLLLRWENQLFVQSHVASTLWETIERDTSFLSNNSVMDYSLLLGIDNNQLVVGIIDYIRTFTWDKKLEHLVKKNLGSGQPTVVSPQLYKQRFCKACFKYFLQCPTHWDHLCNITHA